MEEKFEEKEGIAVPDEKNVPEEKPVVPEKRRKTRKKIFGKKIAKSTVLLVTVFCISFLATANFYMKSKNLVFADELQKVEELVETVNEQKKEITTLKDDVDKYKKLYEEYKEAYEEEKEKKSTKTISTTKNTKKTTTTSKSSSSASKNTTSKSTETNNTEKKTETKPEVSSESAANDEKKEAASTDNSVVNVPVSPVETIPEQSSDVTVTEPVVMPQPNNYTAPSAATGNNSPIQPSQPAGSAAPKINIGGSDAQ